jgi:hypothetical protein
MILVNKRFYSLALRFRTRHLVATFGPKNNGTNEDEVLGDLKRLSLVSEGFVSQWDAKKEIEEREGLVHRWEVEAEKLKRTRRLLKFLEDSTGLNVVQSICSLSIHYLEKTPWIERPRIDPLREVHSPLHPLDQNSLAPEITVRAHESSTGKSITDQTSTHHAETEKLESNTNFGTLVSLLSRFSILEKVNFHGPVQVPVILLEALQKYNPKASLHVHDWVRNRAGDDDEDVAELALGAFPNLKTIKTRTLGLRLIKDPERPGLKPREVPDMTLVVLKRIIAVSTSLEHVDVCQRAIGCTRWRAYTPEQDAEQERRTQLFFFGSERVTSSAKFFNSEGGFCFKTLEWLTDLDRLESLSYQYYYCPELFSWRPKPCFKHLDLILSYKPLGNNEKLESFLASCPPLESLKLTISPTQPYVDIDKWLIPLPTILLVHGSTLRKLAFHDVECSFGSIPPFRLPSNEDIQDIVAGCPVLEDLEIDLRGIPDAKSIKSLLSILAGALNLTILRFHIYTGRRKKRMVSGFSKGLEDFEMMWPPNDCDVDSHNHDWSHWLKKFWECIQSEKGALGTAPLKEIHLMVGEWNRFPARVSGAHPNEERNRRYFVVKPSVRDDRPSEIGIHTMVKTLTAYEEESHEIIEVSCPEEKKEENNVESK